jgi:hypothetical protein
MNFVLIRYVFSTHQKIHFLFFISVSSFHLEIVYLNYQKYLVLYLLGHIHL